MPVSIPDGFAEGAKLSMRGIDARWIIRLASCGLINPSLATKNDIGYVVPLDKQTYEDLRQKLEWLRPYSDVDPVVTCVVEKMDHILTAWAHENMREKS